ncbi:ABC transporter substrate-binding protein [Planctomycetota bacterium]
MAARPMNVAVWFAVVLMITGCTRSGGETGKDGTGKVRIAVACPMSGSGAAYGEMMSKAVRLKVEEINAAGGIDGREVELLIEDDRGDTSEAAIVSRKLAADKSVSIVIGHFNSTCSNAAKEEYNRKGVLQFSSGSTNISVCAGSPWTFRNLYRDDYQGTFLARYASGVLGAKKVAVFYDNDDYGKGLMEAFLKEAKKLGLEVMEPIPYVRERTQDFKPLVSQIKGRDVDAIFLSGLYNEGALITRAARQDLGIKAHLLAGDGIMNQKFIELAGSSAEGTFVTTPFLFEAAKDNKDAKAFFESFKKKFQQEPDTWAALAYDAVGMAARAIDEVGTDREAIKSWFAEVTDASKAYSGVTGATWFDQEGDCYSKGAHVAVVRDGAFAVAERQLTLTE